MEDVFGVTGRSDTANEHASNNDADDKKSSQACILAHCS
jgi:hypothetical protein